MLLVQGPQSENHWSPAMPKNEQKHNCLAQSWLFPLNSTASATYSRPHTGSVLGRVSAPTGEAEGGWSPGWRSGSSSISETHIHTFPRAAATREHKLGASNSRKLPSQFRRPEVPNPGISRLVLQASRERPSLLLPASGAHQEFFGS